jgi:CTP synthase
MQFVELPADKHPYFVACQYHPELTSRPLRPAPMFMGLIAAAIRRRNPHTESDETISRWLPAIPEPARV